MFKGITKVRKACFWGLTILLICLLTACGGGSGSAPVEQSDPDEDIIVIPNIYFEELVSQIEGYEPAQPACAVIINNSELLATHGITATKTLDLDESGEQLTVIPYASAASVEVLSVDSISEDGTLYLDRVFIDSGGADDVAITLNVARSEGAPAYVIRITTQEGDVYDYPITYNGKDGNPDIEPVY